MFEHLCGGDQIIPLALKNFIRREKHIVDVNVKAAPLEQCRQHRFGTGAKIQRRLNRRMEGEDAIVDKIIKHLHIAPARQAIVMAQILFFLQFRREDFCLPAKYALAKTALEIIHLELFVPEDTGGALTNYTLGIRHGLHYNIVV